MEIAEVTESVGLILPIVIFVVGMIGIVAWFAFGSKGGRGARIAAWLGLVSMTLLIGSATAFVLIHVLLFFVGSTAAMIGVLLTTAFMVLMPFGWAILIRHQGQGRTASAPH